MWKLQIAQTVSHGYWKRSSERLCPRINQIGEVFKTNPEQAKSLTTTILLEYLEKHKLKMWFNPEEDVDEYHDDLQKYSTDLAARTLLLMVMSHAVKYGDPVCIRACHRYYLLSLYNLVTEFV